MPTASVDAPSPLAGTGLYRAHLAFAQVRLVQSDGRLTHNASRYRPYENTATACVVSIEALVASASGGV